MSVESLSIAQVSPHPWGARHEINEFVRRTSEELAARESRRLIRDAAKEPGALLTGENPRVVAVGQSIPLPSGPRSRPAPLPLDISGALERLLGAVPLDLVHVHEPFAPSTGSAALRHSQSLNVATFHEPVERVLSTQVARMLVEVFFGRIDERLASNEATGELLQRFFPGQYQLVRPGADVAEPALEPRPPGRVRIVHCAEEERGALRLLLRALRKLPEDLDWEGVIWFDGPTDPIARVSKRLRQRLRVVRPRDGEPAEFLAGADVAVLASGGVRAAPGVVRKAFAAGAVPVVSDLQLYRELVGEGERGLLFPLGDVLTLTAQVERPSTTGSPGGAKTRKATPRSAHASGGGTTSTATCICTPITRRIARPRRNCCSRPPRSRGWARSRSRTTTRSRGRWRPVRSPSGSGGSR
jgi:glycosyltransferase involved in cell wall biosynthesis